MRRYAAIDIMSVMENLADRDREAEFMVQIPETAFISNFTMLINDELFIPEIKGTHSFVLLPTAREGNVFTLVCDSVHNRPYGYSVTAHPCWLLGHSLLWRGWDASYGIAFLFLLRQK